MRARPSSIRSSSSGFTLVEVLAAIAVVVLLASLLVPFVGKARDRALQAKCLSQLRSTYTAAQLYTTDNNGEVIPGSIKQEGVSGEGDLWSARLVPYFNEENNSKSSNFACPSWRTDNVSKTAYNWGYGMNLTPGFEGASSNAAQKGVSVITNKNDGTVTGATFRQSAITHQSRRLYFCDSYQWHVRGQQVVPAKPGETLAAYNRHGSERCNVVFFDGHMEALTPRQVDMAIYDPANFVSASK